MASTPDKKYSFGMSLTVLTKQVGMYMYVVINLHKFNEKYHTPWSCMCQELLQNAYSIMHRYLTENEA